MEVRKDYILDRYVYIATGRAKRPREFKQEVFEKISKDCFFCPGNENQTPPEIGRIIDGDSWSLRWFRNKFPAVEPKGNPKLKTKNKYYTSSSAYGEHEVVVECKEHDKQLWDLGEKQITKLLKVYNERIEKLSKKKNIKYVQLFKNHGREGGTSLIHSHTQITSLTQIPQVVQEEALAVKKHKSCPYCKIIELEKKSERLCFENSSFVAFAPYAARFNYEVWFFPKRHVKTMKELEEHEFEDLARLMKKVLTKLKTINASYNYFVHYAPKGSNLHFHIELTPRLATWAGFELATNFIINSVAPEEAAKFYRE